LPITAYVTTSIYQHDFVYANDGFRYG
jgi:hypothetical protein